MSENLEAMPDQQLSELFAVEVAGWTPIGNGLWRVAGEDAVFTPPKFAASPGDALPWLEKESRDDRNRVHAGMSTMMTTEGHAKVWIVGVIDNAMNRQHEGIALTLSRAIW